MNLNKSLNLTAVWYQKYYQQHNVVDIYLEQIKFFKNLCKIKK